MRKGEICVRARARGWGGGAQGWQEKTARRTVRKPRVREAGKRPDCVTWVRPWAVLVINRKFLHFIPPQFLPLSRSRPFLPLSLMA